MMSCTTSAAWSHLQCQQRGVVISSQHRGAVLPGHIITVVKSRSGQLGRCCTIESHCSGMHVLQVLR
jgi:hypothetical protein